MVEVLPFVRSFLVGRLGKAAHRTVIGMGCGILSLCVLATAAGAQQRLLNVYNWSDYIAEDAVPKFTAESGIKVNYDVYDANEVLETKLTAGRSGYDLVVPTLSPFLARQLKAGLYQKVDKSKLPNLKNLDPEIMALLARVDPGNEHAVPWMWGTSGIGYNVDKVKRIMADAPVFSLAMMFDPDVVKRFQGCGVEMLDSPTDVLPAVLKYLGRNPDSQTKEDLDAAVAQMSKIRPYIRKFHSSEYINDLATGNACLAFGFSGDVLQAAARARTANRGVVIQYSIPTEGALFWVDSWVIPADAAHVDEAQAFLNYVLRPEVAAASSNAVGYASPNKAAFDLVDEQVRLNPSVYPPDSVRAKFYTISVPSPEFDRMRTRAWTRIKTGR